MSIVFPKGVEPHTALLGVNNLVPGAEMLGYGFNIFGSYSFESAIKPLMNLGAPSDWTAPSGKVYSLPANVPTPGGSGSSASAQSFASSSQFTSYFQGSASVSGSIGAFSATFSGSYSQAQQDASTYNWALVEADFLAWHVGLNYDISLVLDPVKNDPDWQALPSQFDPSSETNVLAFYRFFQKFGTHFISNVAVGGALYYYYAVQTSAHYSASDTQLSASAEYNGLISKTSAEASAHWQQCSTNWTSHRQSHAMTVPATTGVINWVNPPNGSFDQSGNFAQWSTEVVQNPSRCKFQLTPIWQLFSGDRWTALQQAFAAYASNRVLVQASPSSNGLIMVNGKPIVPPGGWPANPLAGSWQLAVFDRKSLSVQLNKLYTFNWNSPNWPDDVQNVMVSDLQPYVGSDRYMLATATSFLDEGNNPNSQLYATLKSFGAGAGLDAWMGRPHACSGPRSAYGLIGDGGSVNGIEGFTDPGELDAPWTAPSLALNALLLPTGGNFTPVPYQP
jgi:hypothetical protein